MGDALAFLEQDRVGTVIHGDNLPVLMAMPDKWADLIYIDPPFNTGKTQTRARLRTERHPEGDRTGFQGERYRTTVVGRQSFPDLFDDYLAFLEPRLREAYRILKTHGSLYFHIDFREAHYCKVLLDQIFGREAFLNEIIWAYDYGGRPRDRWPPKHDTIFLYARTPGQHRFNREQVERIPYMAPGLVGERKARKGKLPTDTWWHTIVSPTGKEKTGYPTQKPVGILRRILQASSGEGDLVLDFFAGSGTTGAAALELERRFCLVDNNPQAIEVMKRRFSGEPVVFLEWGQRQTADWPLPDGEKREPDE